MPRRKRKSRGPHPDVKLELYVPGLLKTSVMVYGPIEVIQRFESLCEQGGYTRWEVLEGLMMVASKYADEEKHKPKKSSEDTK